VLITILVIASGCAKRIPISYDQAKPNALVKIQTFSGQSCSGVIQKKEANYLVLKESKYDNHPTKINRDEIASISGRDFVHDGTGEIISEWEIEENRENKNLLLYTIGGVGLSFGASFFIGSLINRNADDADEGKRLMWGTTIVGTATGTYLFAKAGRKRDRLLAIEELREQRFKLAKERYDSQKIKSDSIRKELEKEKAERAKQQEELKRLKEKAQKKKKK
jgi:hypothetical protein